MYSRTTRNITVTVEPVYLEEQSDPEDDRFLWAYHIKIQNHGAETVTLRHRYWKIIDATGRVQEVRGAGVVGEQPRLKPSESFEYTSGAPLNTPSGIMMGTYEMEPDDGEAFDVAIPPFSLDSPFQPVKLQ